MFVANFHLITNSDILPYINEDQLNNTVKKTAFAILGSLILFVAALQNKYQFNQHKSPLGWRF
jgi:hypothetical protein